MPPYDSNIKKEILNEAHHAKYIIQLRSMKMYQNPSGRYWVNNMAQEIAKYVSNLVWQQVNTKH